jgi:hypothetical protein
LLLLFLYIIIININLLPTTIKLVGKSMERGQQSDKQLQEQAPVAATTAIASTEDELQVHKLTVEEGNNPNKVVNKLNRRIILPTHTSRPSTESILKRCPKYTADMPPKKKQKQTKSAATNRGHNWTKMEDLFICISYVNVCDDPVVGNGQKSKEFWGRIYTRFQDLVKKRKNELEEWVRGIHREENSMKIRFTKQIAKFVHLYNPLYKKIKDSNPSGKNEEDIRNDAMELYLEQHGEPFKFLHCLDELWKLPKFKPGEEVIEVGSDDENPALVGKSEGGVNNTLNVMGANLARPIGTKAAKQLIKEEKSVASLRVNVETSKAASMRGMVKAHRTIAHAMADKMKLMKEKVQLREMDMLTRHIEYLERIGAYEEAGRLARSLRTTWMNRVLDGNNNDARASAAASSPLTGSDDPESSSENVPEEVIVLEPEE